MGFAVYTAFFILLISLQTAAEPLLPWIFIHYDLLTPTVAYITLFRPQFYEISAALTAGLLMDLLSQAPPGAYFLSYALILMIFHNARKYFRFRSIGMFQIASVAGILIGHGVFCLLESIHSMRLQAPDSAARALIFQISIAIALNPLMFLVLKQGFKGFDQWMARTFRHQV